MTKWQNRNDNFLEKIYLKHARHERLGFQYTQHALIGDGITPEAKTLNVRHMSYFNHMFNFNHMT